MCCVAQKHFVIAKIFYFQHKMTSCPRGKTKSKLSGRCIKKCKSGQKRNSSNQCVSRSSKTRRKTTKRKTTKRKTTKRKTTRRKTTKRKTSRRKTTKRRVSRKVAGSRKMANFINRIEGRKVVKVSRKGNLRPSAGQAYRDGARLGSRACYDGKCKYLRLDKNGRAYWGV
jgi:flagellum-specific peptidoglycan hydrolase FlgJ